MGYDISQQSREQLLEELTAQSVACCYSPLDPVGQEVLYSVEVGPGGKRYLRVCLFTEEQGFGWGYKTIDECQGPCACSCPVGLLDQCDPPASRGAKKWRDKVRRAAA